MNRFAGWLVDMHGQQNLEYVRYDGDGRYTVLVANNGAIFLRGWG